MGDFIAAERFHFPGAHRSFIDYREEVRMRSRKNYKAESFLRDPSEITNLGIPIISGEEGTIKEYSTLDIAPKVPAGFGITVPLNSAKYATPL
jgi:hypothetical protein